MTARAVLFDVDGTLIDSTYHHAIAWARAFARFDLYPPLWRVHRSIGMGGDQLVPNLVGVDVESKHGGDLRDAWEAEYEKLLPEVRGFDGAADAVRASLDEPLGYSFLLAAQLQGQVAEQAAVQRTCVDQRRALALGLREQEQTQSLQGWARARQQCLPLRALGGPVSVDYGQR